MKRVIEIIIGAVSFLFAAIFITYMVTNFNKGYAAAKKNADDIFAIIENTDIGTVNVSEYDGKTILGSEVISIIENLPTNTNNLNILVYTNAGKTVSEYTRNGPTADFELTALTKNPYSAAKATDVVVSTNVTGGSGKYKNKTDLAYINPTQSYTVKCHYTDNQAIAFVSITQKTN